MGRKQRHDLSPLRPISIVSVTYGASLAWAVGTLAYCVLFALFVAANGGDVPQWTFRGMAIACLSALTSAILFDLYKHEGESRQTDGNE
ncbi:hypothetical protein [Halococcus sp. PRR34]|uniref:hypothetical protein n=1 Tax=Halococcus sp. PRR34 TaxID=3020830 RepID=UPI00235DFC78|nr:hypothetical protein [Halococcus sp. PRR34]